MKNLLTQHCRLLVHGMVRAGVRRIVVCPGSRSTPLVLAATKADADVSWVHDERGAAFLALGHARVTGAPTMLICTSGTAAAHFYPAVLEAEAAHLPLIVVSADRPPELIGVGAPQTIDQRQLFGNHVRKEIRLGLPEPSEDALDGVADAAMEAVRTSRAPIAGPVHVNVPARKPLEEFAAEREEEIALVRAVDERLSKITEPRLRSPRVADEGVERIANALAQAKRPLVVAGPLPLHTKVRNVVTKLVKDSGAVLVADVTSQLRCATAISTADAFIHRAPPELAPDFILRIGRAPTVTGWSNFFAAHAAVETVVLAGSSHSDPYGTADEVLLGDIDDALVRIADRAAAHDGHGAWWDEWHEHDRRARGAIETLEWSEARVADTLVRRLPKETILVAGNSLAVRHLDLYAPPTDHGVLSQRGVNGIDGLIAGAVGAASASGRPVALLIGDVSYLHDIGSLALARGITTPLLIVVIDNRGGRIFEQLPLAKTGHSDAVMDFFVTPHDFDLGAGARTYGLSFRAVHDDASFQSAIDMAISESKATVIAATVPPSGAAAVLASVRNEVLG